MKASRAGRYVDGDGREVNWKAAVELGSRPILIRSGQVLAAVLNHPAQPPESMK